MNLIQTLEREQMDAVRGGRKLPPFRPGDTLKVNVKVVDVSYDEKTKQQKTRERLQAFEGVCIGRQGAGAQRELHRTEDFLRRGRGARVPGLQPVGGLVEVVRRGKVRRAKLYYLRGLRGKKARIAERQRGSDGSWRRRQRGCG
jgi:large subunit ribosomal protein L19